MHNTLKAFTDNLIQQNNTGDSILNEIKFNPENIIHNDGIIISVVGYLVVFLSLLLLYFVFVNLTKVLQNRVRTRLRREGNIQVAENDISLSGEINAAISLALHLYIEEVHDFENTVLTIRKVQKPYSPWSSKIYGLREFPRK
ncbi:MAG: hypothetical protein Kow0098_20220 [Ignavibacteriaceae bacterium]